MIPDKVLAQPPDAPGDGGRMLHHISLPVADLARSSKLYDGILATLGYRRVCSGKGYAGYGVTDGEDLFAIKNVTPATSAGPGFHLAFGAPSRAAVDEFHRLALANGATNGGKPGLRPHYGPTYYAAFIVDFDGHRVEAVIV